MHEAFFRQIHIDTIHAKQLFWAVLAAYWAANVKKSAKMLMHAHRRTHTCARTTAG